MDAARLLDHRSESDLKADTHSSILSVYYNVNDISYII